MCACTGVLGNVSFCLSHVLLCVCGGGGGVCIYICACTVGNWWDVLSVTSFVVYVSLGEGGGEGGLVDSSWSCWMYICVCVCCRGVGDLYILHVYFILVCVLCVQAYVFALVCLCCVHALCLPVCVDLFTYIVRTASRWFYSQLQWSHCLLGFYELSVYFLVVFLGWLNNVLPNGGWYINVFVIFLSFCVCVCTFILISLCVINIFHK